MRIRTFAALFLTVLALGCAGDGGSHATDPSSGDAPAARYIGTSTATLEMGDELAGSTITSSTSEDGWSFRSTRGDDADVGRKSDRRRLGRFGGGGVGGVGGGAGAGMPMDRGDDAPAEAARAPAKSAAPKPASSPPPAPESERREVSEELSDADLSTGDFDTELATSSSVAPKRNSAPVRQLKAGSTDDNAAYGEFLAFLATWGNRDGMETRYQPLDVSDRRHVRVVDAAGRPVPGAELAIVDLDGDVVLFEGTTYGDGRVPFYPHLGRTKDEAAAAKGLGRSLFLEVRSGDTVATRTWDGFGDEVEVVLADDHTLAEPLALDVCLLIDTTGSMGDEIASIKASLLRMTEKLRALDREFDLRYSAVLYRDIGDQYVTATHPFTGDVDAFDKALETVQAAGGGDGPESLNQGLAQAVDGVDWRDGAAKVCFLIADAPPHMDYAGDVWYGESLRRAVAQGIRVHSVAASGLGEVGSLVFRQIAQYTRGEFIFIEYGSAAASAASHGVEGPVKSDNLEDILYGKVADELANWGR